MSRRLLANDVVRYVGQPVALVIAESRYIAEDAAELVSIDYEVMPAVSALRHAIRGGAALVHEDAERDVAARAGSRLATSTPRLRLRRTSSEKNLRSAAVMPSPSKRGRLSRVRPGPSTTQCLGGNASSYSS